MRKRFLFSFIIVFLKAKRVFLFLSNHQSFFEASYEKGASHLQLLRSIVSLDGFGLDDDRGVGALPELRLGGDGSGDVTRTQSERGAECRQRCYQHGDNDFDNLFLSHNFNNFLTVKRSNSEAVCQCNGLSDRRSVSNGGLIAY